MKWLITVKKNADLTKLRKQLASWGAELDPDVPPTPLDNGEQTIGIIGPKDLAQRAEVRRTVHGIYPNSEMQLYD
jgi:hypothetical protein